MGSRSRDFSCLPSRLSLCGLDRRRNPGPRDEQKPHDVPALARFCANKLGPFLLGLSALEINLTPLLTVIGAAGFVVAFALQGTLSNFASGLLIMAFKPFDVGDEVEVSGGIKGKVTHVTIFSTYIRSDDGLQKIVPTTPSGRTSLSTRRPEQRKARQPPTRRSRPADRDRLMTRRSSGGAPKCSPHPRRRVRCSRRRLQ